MNPALALLPWGRIAGLSAVLVLLGWAAWAIRESGKEAGIAEGEKERADLVADLIHERSQANTCAATLDRITTETERGIAEAAARAAAGERAAAQAAEAAKAATKAKDRAEKALANAMRDPECSELLRSQVCPAVELL